LNQFKNKLVRDMKLLQALILYHFRDKVRYWSRIAIYSYPRAFDVTSKGAS